MEYEPVFNLPTRIAGPRSDAETLIGYDSRGNMTSTTDAVGRRPPTLSTREAS